MSQLDTMFHETPFEYAQRRANETGHAYVVTEFHALLDCPQTREVIKLMECNVIARFTKE
jgi:hypothetical protein